MRNPTLLAMLGAISWSVTACGPSFPEEIQGMWSRCYVGTCESWIFETHTASLSDSAWGSSTTYDLVELISEEQCFRLNVNGRDVWWITYEIRAGGERLCMDIETDGYGGTPSCDEVVNPEFDRLDIE